MRDEDITATDLNRRGNHYAREINHSGKWRYVRSHDRRQAVLSDPDLFERALSALLEKEAAQGSPEATRPRGATPRAA